MKNETCSTQVKANSQLGIEFVSFFIISWSSRGGFQQFRSAAGFDNDFMPDTFLVFDETTWRLY